MRYDYRAAAPGVVEAMRGLEREIARSGLERPLLHLVKIRASQLNGCAFCLTMHIREAREDGERQERIDLLPAWREAPFYNARERAALAWTEAVTLLPQTGVPDDVYEQARAVFSPTELAYLTLAIVAINGWNRLNVSFRIPPEVEDVSVERVYHA